MTSRMTKQEAGYHILRVFVLGVKVCGEGRERKPARNTGRNFGHNVRRLTCR